MTVEIDPAQLGMEEREHPSLYLIKYRNRKILFKIVLGISNSLYEKLVLVSLNAERSISKQ